MFGAEPRTQWLRDLVKLNDRGSIRAGRDVPPGAWPLPPPTHAVRDEPAGRFTAGDVRYGSVKRVAGAVAKGCPGQIPVSGIYAGLPVACRMASDEIRLLQ